MTQQLKSVQHKHICPSCGIVRLCTSSMCTDLHAVVCPTCYKIQQCQRDQEQIEPLTPVTVKKLRRNGLEADLVVRRNGRIRIIVVTRPGTIVSQTVDKMPRTHTEFLRAARSAMGCLPKREARWPDGTLRGFKGFSIGIGGILMSPLRGSLWPDATCTAHAYTGDDLLRGIAGIHACWPQRNLERPFGQEIEPDWVLAEIAGHGMCATGEIGWRSQHALIKKVYRGTTENVIWNRIVKQYRTKGVELCK